MGVVRSDPPGEMTPLPHPEQASSGTPPHVAPPSAPELRRSQAAAARLAGGGRPRQRRAKASTRADAERPPHGRKRAMPSRVPPAQRERESGSAVAVTYLHRGGHGEGHGATWRAMWRATGRVTRRATGRVTRRATGPCGVRVAGHARRLRAAGQAGRLPSHDGERAREGRGEEAAETDRAERDAVRPRHVRVHLPQPGAWRVRMWRLRIRIAWPWHARLHVRSTR